MLLCYMRIKSSGRKTRIICVHNPSSALKFSPCNLTEVSVDRTKQPSEFFVRNARLELITYSIYTSLTKSYGRMLCNKMRMKLNFFSQYVCERTT